MVQFLLIVSTKIAVFHLEKHSSGWKEPRTNKSRVQSTQSFVVTIEEYELAFPSTSYISCLAQSIEIILKNVTFSRLS
jgi:hypothetical protein